MNNTFNRENFLKDINIISNNVIFNLGNEKYDIFEDMNYLYSFLSAFSLAFIFTNGYENINNIDKENILSIFSSNKTITNFLKIEEYNINDKESIDYILYIIEDTINVYKYPENQVFEGEINSLSINPFLYTLNEEYDNNILINDKIITILTEISNYVKNIKFNK